MGACFATGAWYYLGNFAGAFTVAVFMAIIFDLRLQHRNPTPSARPSATSVKGERSATPPHGAAGMLTLFIRGVLCNWMVSTGVVAAMMSTTVSGKVIGMWMPIMLFFYMGFEH